MGTVWGGGSHREAKANRCDEDSSKLMETLLIANEIVASIAIPEWVKPVPPRNSSPQARQQFSAGPGLVSSPPSSASFSTSHILLDRATA